MSDSITITASTDLVEEFAEIAAAYDPPSRALTEMARLIANHFELDVCSLYVVDSYTQELLLVATMGLNQSSVGRIRMKQSEGLAGLVAEERQPVCVAEASRHPRFKYFPEAGEERYSSFVGFPVLQDECLHGVLVIQTVDPRQFSAAELSLMEVAFAAMTPYVMNCRLVEFLRSDRSEEI